MLILRRLTALVTLLPLLQLSLQGSAVSCFLREPSAIGQDSATSATTVAMSAMHHEMPSADATQQRLPASDDHGSDCPDRHPTGSCASMPTCASVAAMPAADAVLFAAPVHGVVASAALDTPPAPGLAPELPPPRV